VESTAERSAIRFEPGGNVKVGGSIPLLSSIDRSYNGIMDGCYPLRCRFDPCPVSQCFYGVMVAPLASTQLVGVQVPLDAPTLTLAYGEVDYQHPVKVPEMGSSPIRQPNRKAR
jgi:hypothetical protein